MSCAALTAMLQHEVTYKPGVTFLFQNGGDRIIVHMSTPTEDARGPHRTLQGYTAVYEYGRYGADPRMVGVFLREMIRRFELHEADEWLMIGGNRVSDPHAAGVDPDPADTRP